MKTCIENCIYIINENAVIKTSDNKSSGITVLKHQTGEDLEQIIHSYKSAIGDSEIVVTEASADLVSLRAAVIAAKECSCTVIPCIKANDDISIEAYAVTLEAAEADAIGISADSFNDMQKYTRKVQSSSSLPIYADTKNELTQDEIAKLVALNVRIFSSNVDVDITVPELKCCNKALLASSTYVLEINPNNKTYIIGERVNPTGKPKLAKAMVDMDIEYIKKRVETQMRDGSDIIDVNVGAAGVDENTLLTKLATELSAFDTPVCFDSFNTDAIEVALRNYCGRALVNSASAANGDYEKIIDLAVKYGAMLILLPYAHKMSLTCEDRIEALKPLLECAYEKGLTKTDILVDGVIMAVANDVTAPNEAAKFVQWCKNEGLMTVAGVSNISFGLPNREAINREFLSMLINAGLTTGILNPTKENNEIIDACHLLSGKDEWCMSWINKNR